MNKDVLEMCIDDILNLIVGKFPNEYCAGLLHDMRVDWINQMLSEYYE